MVGDRETVVNCNWHPTPAGELPDRVILFDGVCVLCSRLVAFVIAHDRAARYRFLPMQTPLGREVAARFGIDPDNPQTNVVVADGYAYFKLESALVVLADLTGWRWTRVALVLPKRMRNFLYDRVARNRYRLFGRRTTCLLPSRDLRDRFIGENLFPAPGTGSSSASSFSSPSPQSVGSTGVTDQDDHSPRCRFQNAGH